MFAIILIWSDSIPNPGMELNWSQHNDNVPGVCEEEMCIQLADEQGRDRHNDIPGWNGEEEKRSCQFLQRYFWTTNNVGPITWPILPTVL